MNRSAVNQILQQTQHFFARFDVHLPSFAHFSPTVWRQLDRQPWQEVFDLKLGWDVTAFGGEDFAHKGLTLFTLRNGSPGGQPYAKCYAEKIMHCREAQVTPMHFHWRKREDIINRGGGNLIVELHNADPQEGLADSPVTVTLDGCRQTHAPCSRLRLAPGESICLTPGIYHSFWGEEGFGDVLVGEVSTVNDDDNDNRFLTPLSRFSQIEEDQPPQWLLCNEYLRFID
ncbi:TPA: D-lyxose/D-mannose family sugar isomerase [Serratia liquefaciens]|uniref:D-lyxose/D-mannose isomerase n=1 Tax=Serratia liquefaciens TaxID=614 RepID=UPI0021C82133|nr:D-lyxose/D-mannose family sugar isomerase [Serratia liquefaciens]MDU4174284.1 D-lyxose/D-mannose family sugar isomerase [Serratia liquefaciens]